MFEAVVLQSHEVRLEPAAGAVRPSIQLFPNPTRVHPKLADEFLQLTETTEFQPHEGSSETAYLLVSGDLCEQFQPHEGSSETTR